MSFVYQVKFSFLNEKLKCKLENYTVLVSVISCISIFLLTIFVERKETEEECSFFELNSRSAITYNADVAKVHAHYSLRQKRGEEHEAVLSTCYL